MSKKTEKRLHTFTIPEVKPQGWLKRQLEIQMQGLTGILYDIWDSVGSYSGWLGGTGENWERAPYYLDGLLPLAYYLDDTRHWETACRFVEWTLGSQDEEGNFGPIASKDDYWSRFVMLKVLIQYYEIKRDGRVLKLFDKYFQYLYKRIREVPMKQWSSARIGDLLYCIRWYCEQGEKEHIHTEGDSFDIHALVRMLRELALDWADIFEDFPFTRPAGYYYNWDKEYSHFSWEDYHDTMKYHANHIVNVTMGFKYPAMLSYFFEDRDYEAISLAGIENARKYHGVASGAVNGDEHLSGNNPSQGAELCSVVEYMFSLQTMLEAFGLPDFADQMERLAYNALPATITEDFMAHQYVQQANQVLVSRAKRCWFNNNEESNMFGLEPNFGCCTANMHQGWPKFVKSLWYRAEDLGLVSMVFAPCSLETEAEGRKICIREETEYPFKDKITYHVEEASHENLEFGIRIPQWCTSYKLYKNGTCIKEEDHREKTGVIMPVCRGLKTGDVIRAEFSMDIERSYWFRNSMAVERGPLVYALDMKEKWKTVKEVAGVRDYEVYPESAWNYALEENPVFEVSINPVGETPFSKAHPPVKLKTKGRRLDAWELEANSAGTLPTSPVRPDGEEEEIALIPYGCTKLRVSQFPWYINEDR